MVFLFDKRVQLVLRFPFDLFPDLRTGTRGPSYVKISSHSITIVITLKLRFHKFKTSFFRVLCSTVVDRADG